MVLVSDMLGGFCIDATKITNAQYNAFLTAVAMDPTFQQPAKCAWNMSLMPAGMMNAPDFPVVNVDWCDAHAYCAWAGKRLCGRIGGGANPFAAFADASSSQWYAACSAGGTKAFPYGAAYDPLACNGGDDPTPGIVAVGARRPGASEGTRAFTT
jgi:formylglycine-generating enzyme required for sulfatase activity